MRLIVIHITDGQPRTDRCVERFQQPKTKAAPHFVVGRAGEVVQPLLRNSKIGNGA